MKLSIAQIQDYMRQAGWPEGLIVTGAAVFYFESNHGETTAHKVDNVERSYGLAQINLGLPGTRLAAERAAWGPAERLYDPVYNLQLAYQIYQQQGWGAWSNTYYGGRYKTYLAASQQAYAGAGEQGQAPAIITTDAGTGDVMQLGAITGGGAGAGAILLIGGLIFAYWYLSD